MEHAAYQLFFFGLLQLSSAHGINCTVTQEAGLTLYTVPEFMASGCHYRWANMTDHVLANHLNETDEMVVMKSNRSLLISGCFEFIYYMRDCISEGMPCEAICSINCSGSGGLQKRGGVSRNHWAVAVVLVALLLVVLFLCVKCKIS